MKEEWRPFRDTSYAFSNLGRVFNSRTSKFKTPSRSGNGYLIVGLFQNKRRTNVLVHRAVAECFIDKIVSPLEVNHKDGDKLNNAAANLEIVSRSVNMKHAIANGLYAMPTKRVYGDNHWTRRKPHLVKRGKENGAAMHPEKILRGSQTPSSKLNEEKVSQIRTMHSEGKSYSAIGRYFNVTHQTIRYIIIGHTWKHTLPKS